MNKLHLIVRDQFPDFVREDYPVFVAFVEAYYKWLDEQSVGKIEAVSDLDTTPEQFVQYFKSQLDAFGVFDSLTPFNSLYLQRIKDIYNSKGSQQALVNILRLTYNAETEILYPGQYVLKASDGKWFQESFIVVELVYGSMPESAYECYVRYDNVDIRLEVSHLQKITSTATRIYFKLRYGFSVNEGQIVYFYDSNKDIQFAGRIVRIPLKISVLRGGKNWQLGQVIVIPGSVSDTVARVSEVTTDGQAVAIDILQYGYQHTENQILIVSPYPDKPLATTFDITAVQTQINPPKYSYTLSINDYTDGTTDRVRGISSGVMSSSYFLQDYVESGYVGSIMFDNVTSQIVTNEIVDSSVSLEEWLESRATIRYEYGTLVTEQGRWLDDSGTLSNESIKLQDNFYYQQYAYDIQSDADVESYKQLANLLNPAGAKMFTTYNLSEILEVELSAVTSFPFFTYDALDVSTISDIDVKSTVKSPNEELTILDLGKQNVIKNPAEILTLSDSNNQSLTKRITEALTSSDLYNRSLIKNQSETQLVNDVCSKLYNKYITDSATIASSDNFVYTVTQYNTESYFEENYVLTEKFLTIGE